MIFVYEICCDIVESLLQKWFYSRSATKVNNKISNLLYNIYKLERLCSKLKRTKINLF